MHLTAWLISPKDVRTGELAPKLSGGHMSYSDVAWPKGMEETGAKTVGWYRIGYSVE